MEKEFKIPAPILDMNVIQKAAQDAAMKAALKEVEDYYLGYSSTYRKNLHEYLEKNAPSIKLELPEFSELISKSLSAEIENIVNKTCTERFAQELRSCFSHLNEEEDGTILLTTLANNMMAGIDFEDTGRNNSFELEVSEGCFPYWKDVHVTIFEYDVDKHYDFTLTPNSSDGTYSIISMPTKIDDEHYTTNKVNIKSETCTISFPMFSGVTNDRILLILARCVMFNAHIRINEDHISKESSYYD